MKKAADVKFLELQGMYLTTEQAAKEIGISAKRLRNMKAEGKGPSYIRMGDGKSIRYRRSDLLAWCFSIKTTGVKCSESKIEVRNPIIDYDFCLYGENVRNRLPNANEAVSRICDEMIKNSADGFLCIYYCYLGLKSRVTTFKTEPLLYIKYIFEAE